MVIFVSFVKIEACCLHCFPHCVLSSGLIDSVDLHKLGMFTYSGTESRKFLCHVNPKF
jgi:hypothetical protein